MLFLTDNFAFLKKRQTIHRKQLKNSMNPLQKGKTKFNGKISVSEVSCRLWILDSNVQRYLKLHKQDTKCALSLRLNSISYLDRWEMK